jgi:hypothetical protein
MAGHSIQEVIVQGYVDKRVDIAVSLVLIVICAAVLFETRGLPPGSFEPLGSAPVPQATAALIILLSIVVLAGAVRRPSVGGTLADLRPFDAAAVVIFTLLFVTLVHFRMATFAVLTTGYLVLTIGWLTRFQRRLIPALLITALVVGFGCQYVFTRIFVVDLPGL